MWRLIEGFNTILGVIQLMSSTVPESIEQAPVEIQGSFPGLWWNEDREESKWNRIDELEADIGSSDVVAVVDSDADGRACEAVIRDKYDNAVVIAANGSEYGISFTHALNIVSENVTDTPVIVADLSPDSEFSSFLASVSKIESDVRVYDHHDWNWTARTSIENAVGQLVVNEDLCAAQVLQRNIHPNADEKMKEFLRVTADHDLWVKEEDRSDHLSTLSFELPRREYVEYALEHGADMVQNSDKLRTIYEESEEKSERMAELAIDQSEILNVDGTKVAITYFGCHQSRVGDMLIEDHGVDLAVIIQPTASVSFRSTEEFGRCSELARGLGGGGHNDAAGASVYNQFDFNPKNVSKEQVYVPEIDQDKSDIDLSSMSKMQYMWRTQGEPVIESMKSYIKAEV